LHAQDERVTTIVNYLLKDRTPDIIIEYLTTCEDKNDFDITVFKRQHLYERVSGVLIVYKKGGSGYFSINQSIEATIDTLDMRKVEYYLNSDIVDSYKGAKRLVKLKEKDIIAIDIDDSKEHEFVKVYIKIDD
jgi:hypothetical protein